MAEKNSRIRPSCTLFVLSVFDPEMNCRAVTHGWSVPERTTNKTGKKLAWRSLIGQIPAIHNKETMPLGTAQSALLPIEFDRISSMRATLSEQGYLLANRALAALGLLLLLPLLTGIAAWVWKTDGAPIFFGHYRVGRNGKLFRCLKFRSMARDSQELLRALLERDPVAREEWQREHKLENDPRITPIGRFLRRTSLDELPQLINVLRGEMLLVGPRPITFEELRKYGRVRWHYLSVRPGITGLWQVSGRNNLSYDERVELDREYVEERSIVKDLSILMRTVKVVLLREGAK